VALGLNLDAMATKGINDFYLEGVEYEDVSDNGPLFQQVKKHIEELDKMSSRKPNVWFACDDHFLRSFPRPGAWTCSIKVNSKSLFLEKNPYITS